MAEARGAAGGVTMFSIRRVQESDILGGFRSGNDALDKFIHRSAKKDTRRRITVTRVLHDGVWLAGYVTTRPGSISGELVQELITPRITKHLQSVLHLVRMASDLRYRGRGVGSALVVEACRVAQSLADEYACIGILVDAKPEAVKFYERLGFHTIEEPAPPERETTTMFFTMDQVAALIAPPAVSGVPSAPSEAISTGT